jgi:hypothetical protein
MVKINKHPEYFEAVFEGGNLYAFSLPELARQLHEIYGINAIPFTFECN